MKRHKFIILFILMMFCSGGFALVQVNTKAPDFHIMDGNDRWLTIGDLKGKVVIGFYEHRSSVEKNQLLKDELNEYKKQWSQYSEGNSFSLAVVDASEANLLSKWVWKKKFREKSRELGITVYGDWDGSMKRAYGIPAEESVFMIIDKKGILRYRYAGMVPVKKFKKIRGIIRTLVR
ncbi:MAG: peroxiredoxin family protein [Spirochaetota bacterium]